jgi:hypothetical protein
MIKFSLHVLVATVLLSTAVWFGLPLLKARQPERYARIAGFSTDRQKQAAVVAGIASATTRLAETVKGAGTEFVETAGQGLAEVSGASAGDSESDASSDSRDASDLSDNGERVETAEPPKSDDVPAVAATNTTVEAPQADVVAEPPDPSAALNADPGYAWGIVVTNSFFYDAQMNRVGIMAGGTVVARKSSRLLPDGNVAECCYLKEDRLWVYEPVHLYEADLVLFEMPYEQADRGQRDLLREYCRLFGRYEAAKAKLYKDMTMRNPHLAEHQETANAYREFSLRAKAIHEEHQTATGARRSELEDQLRKMKAEEGDYRRRYEAAKTQYDAWKQQNVLDPAASGRLKTAEMQSIENRMKALRPDVQAIVPGL